MEADAARFAKGTISLCPQIAGNDLCAIADFAYNLGLGNLRISTLRKRINAGDREAAYRELRKWVRGGGRVLPGLVRRREAEIALMQMAE